MRRIAAMSEEQQKLRRIKDRDYKRRKRAEWKKSRDELKQMIAKNADNVSGGGSAEISETQQNQIRNSDLTIQRERYIRIQLGNFYDKTATARIKLFVSRANYLATKYPHKYQTAGHLIQNIFSDIGDLHKQVEKMIVSLKQMLSDTVSIFVKRHKNIKKRRAEVAYRDLEFVDVPLSIEPNDINRGRSSSGLAETDPLFPQADTDCLRQEFNMPSSKMYEVLTTDIPDESFEVVSHSHSTSVPCEESSKNKSKKLACSICSKEYGTSLGLTIHQKEHSGHSQVKCSVCPQTFNGYKLMTDHYLQVHSFESSIIENDEEAEELDEELERYKYELDFLLLGECFICSKILSRAALQTFSQHLMDDHSENKNCLKYFTFSCSSCNKPHLLRRYLEAHWRIHCMEKWQNREQNNSQIVCGRCGMNFSSEKSLLSHSKMFHGKRKQKVVCEQCGKEYSSEGTLQNHVANVHQTKRKKFECDECGRNFFSSNSLQKHLKAVHLKEKSFECKFCSKRFASSYNLQTHVNTHTGDKPFKCKWCDKRFAAPSGLAIHGGIHNGFKCDTCGESLPSYVDLCQHKKSHKLNADGEGCEDSSKITTCEICGKEFSSYLYLKLHKRNIHEGAKCVCDVCGKEYKNSMSLYNHKQCHYGFKRFVCSLCGKKFTFATNFYKHRKVEHVNENAQCLKVNTKGSTPSAVRRGKPGRVSFDPNSMKERKENPEVPLSTEQAHNEAPSINHSPPVTVAVESNFSNMICETLDPSIQYNNSNYATLDVTPVPEGVDDDSSSKAVFEKITEVDHYRPRCPSAVTHFSSANVSPEATISALEYQTELNNQNDYLITNASKIKAEDECRQQNDDFEDGEYETYSSIGEADDFSMDEVSENEQELTPKIDSISGNITKEDSWLSDDYLKRPKSNFIKSFPSDPYSSQLIVKLKRLLEHKCTICDKTYFMETEREIRQHSRTHRKTAVSLKSHKKKSVTLSKDADQKKKLRDCIHCDEKNLTVEQLVAHSTLEHPGLNAFKCLTCSELFRTPDSLYYHKKASHFGYRRGPRKKEPKMDPSAEKEFLCEECGKAFHSKRSVQSHVVKVHKAQSRFACESCPLSFPTLWRLTRHAVRHTGEKSFLCEDCGKGFYEQRDLNDHVNSIHKNLPRKRKSTSYKRVYKKKEPTFPFSCTICPERFVGEKALKVHMELHDPSRKFCCDVCGLRYKFSSNVIAHKNLKHKNK